MRGLSVEGLRVEGLRVKGLRVEGLRAAGPARGTKAACLVPKCLPARSPGCGAGLSVAVVWGCWGVCGAVGLFASAV